MSDRLNSLADAILSGLGDVSPTEHATDTLRTLLGNPPSTVPEFSYITLKTALENAIAAEKYQKFRSQLSENGWRCTFVFWTKETCNTLNGLDKAGRRIRKECLRCKTRRTNDKTIKQELFLLGEEELREKLVNEIGEIEANKIIEETRKGLNL